MIWTSRSGVLDPSDKSAASASHFAVRLLRGTLSMSHPETDSNETIWPSLFARQNRSNQKNEVAAFLLAWIISHITC